MVKEIRYTSIKRVLDNLTDHPMLTDVTLEQAVRYAIRFIGIFGLPQMYEDKIEDVDIHEFRGLLPCDLISIIQVKDNRTGICLRSITDNFPDGMREADKMGKTHLHSDMPHYVEGIGLKELAFKTQGRVIFTTFRNGSVSIAYKAIRVDEDGFPMLMDNESYLAALEAYIKKQVFTVKFDQGKISSSVLQNAHQEYAWLAGQLNSELTIPSVSEMESISRMITALLPRVRQFDNGFVDLGNREYLRKH